MYIPHYFTCHVEYFEEIKAFKREKKNRGKAAASFSSTRRILCFESTTDKLRLNLNSKLHFIVS